MPCYTPLKGFIKEIDENGKKDLFICSNKVNHIELYTDGKWRASESSERSPYCAKKVDEYILIPCGKCIGCQLDYAKTWADRCLLELLSHDSSYFVTLTYDDCYLPRREVVDLSTGEYKDVYTVCRKDVQDFFKALRQAESVRAKKEGREPIPIRYYGCSEYGPSTARPHYHIIIFGLVLDDLKLYKRKKDYCLYNSEWLSKIWKKGFVVVGDVSYETCAYTARYVTKKVYGNNARDLVDMNVDKPFSFMSLKPAIGKDYFVKHPEIVKQGYKMVSTKNGGVRVYNNRYFDRMFETLFPEDFPLIKERRIFYAQEAEKGRNMLTSLDYFDRLKAEEVIAKKRASVLKRGEI